LTRGVGGLFAVGSVPAEAPDAPRRLLRQFWPRIPAATGRRNLRP